MFQCVLFSIFLLISGIRSEFEVCTTVKGKYECSIEMSMNKLFDQQNISEIRITGNEKDYLNLSEPLKWDEIQQLSIESFQSLSLSVGVFGNLIDLAALSLESCKLTNDGLLSGEVFKANQTKNGFYALPNLLDFSLRNNLLSGLHEDFFIHTRYIETLVLAENPLKLLNTPTIRTLHSLQRLTNLDLSWTKLTKIPSNFLKPFKHLKTLDLTLNFFHEIPNELEEATALSMLNISQNPITDLLPVIKMSQLKSLNSSKLNITSINSDFLKLMPNLESLHMEDNKQLGNIDQNAFVYNTKLKYIDVKGCNLSILNLNIMAIQEIDFRNNGILCLCENQWILKQLFPVMVNKNVTYIKELKCKKTDSSNAEEEHINDYYVKNGTFPCIIDYLIQMDASVVFYGLFSTIAFIYLVALLLFARQKWYLKSTNNAHFKYVELQSTK